jgi:hypothetical protein
VLIFVDGKGESFQNWKSSLEFLSIFISIDLIIYLNII